jgi:hypothetical protein
MEAHKVTTIAAGISSNATTSYQFTQRYNAASVLFLTTNQDLDDEGVVGYFAPENLSDQIKAQIRLLLNDIRYYVGGHIFPLMWLAEKLVPKLVVNGGQGSGAMTAVQAKALLESKEVSNVWLIESCLPIKLTYDACFTTKRMERHVLFSGGKVSATTTTRFCPIYSSCPLFPGHRQRVRLQR